MLIYQLDLDLATRYIVPIPKSSQCGQAPLQRFQEYRYQPY